VKLCSACIGASSALIHIDRDCLRRPTCSDALSSTIGLGLLPGKHYKHPYAAVTLAYLDESLLSYID